MGFFGKLFGGKGEAPPEAAPPPEVPDHPAVVIVLRRGMNLPAPEYVAQVVANAFPDGLPESVPRIGLSQPGWYKTEEVADAITSGVAETFARKHDLGDGVATRRRAIDGPDGCACLVIELRR